MTTQIGMRVGALLDSNPTTKIVQVLGYGTYEGDQSDNFLGIPNPKIKLDSGKVVWGFECWWGPEEEVKKEVANYTANGWTAKDVDIDEVRREVEGNAA